MCLLWSANMRERLLLMLPLWSYVVSSGQAANGTNPTVPDVTNGFWTEWYDVDSPNTGDGDGETPADIKELTGRNVCPETYFIYMANCLPEVPANLTEPCTANGVVCRNKDQTSGICSNYQVRFFCRKKPETETDTESDKHSGYAPRFDMRIYIILAAVPVLIFLLRILWSCVWDRRRRRMPPRGQERQDSTDTESLDLTTFLPPPSYQELFGVGGGPFLLSRQYSLCRQCKSSQCGIFHGRDPDTGIVVRSSSDEPDPGIVNISTLSDQNTHSGRVIRASVSVENETNSGSEENTAPESSSSQDIMEHVNEQAGSNETTSDNDHQVVDSSHCDCPCHKRASENGGHDNMAFAPEVEISDGRSNRLPGMHVPGMHVPVFSLFRSYSHSSLDELPPPSYREALKILKKSKKMKKGDPTA